MDVLVLFMADSSAFIAPAPDEPEGRAGEGGCAVETLKQWQLSVLKELAEIGMEVARAVRNEALAPVEPDAPPKPPSRFGGADLGMVLSRVSRAVRLSLALQSRIAEDIETGRVQREQRRVTALRWAAHERQTEIRDYVAEAIEAEAAELKKPEHEVERLLDDLDERIEAGDYDDAMANAPTGDLVARICADLGVIPAWSLWDDHAWAIEHLRSRDPGDIGADRWRCVEPPPTTAPPEAHGPPPDPG